MNYLSRIIARFERQKAKGIAKYGQPLEQNNREVLEAIEAIAEELTDGLMYLEEVKEKLQNKGVKYNWISVKDELPQNGQEILTYYYDKAFDIHQIYTLEYFYKGTVMDYNISNKFESDKLNLLDTILNHDNDIKAPEDGFYIFDNIDGKNCGYRKHADVITHWMPLPEAPKE